MALNDYKLVTSTDTGTLERVVMALAVDGFLPLGAPLAALRTAGIIAQ